MADDTNPVPGHLYVFTGLAGRRWLVQAVTQTAREDEFDMQHSTINVGDTFMIIVVDDEGPRKLFITELDEFGRVRSTPNTKRWHVMLLNGVMYWFDHVLLQFSNLVSEP